MKKRRNWPRSWPKNLLSAMPGAAEVSKLQLPKLVEQVALNAWKEQDGNQVRLHLRPGQRHLNSPGAQKALAEALATLQGSRLN
ncbi:DNA polymerase III subunit gamma/tau C-terminal domain-containing protein [Enterobacter soli]